MSKNIQLIVFSVKDMAEAKIFYNKFLEVEPYADSPYYVGYKVDNLEVGLTPGTEGGVISYTDTTDIKKSMQDMLDAGGEIAQEVKDVAAGLLVGTVKDSNGNIVGFRQQP